MACLTRHFIVHAVGLNVEMSWWVVVEVARMLWVGRNVVEVMTLVIGSASHAAANYTRCIGHLRWNFGIPRRYVVALLGTQCCTIRISSHQLHSLLTLLFYVDIGFYTFAFITIFNILQRTFERHEGKEKEWGRKRMVYNGTLFTITIMFRWWYKKFFHTLYQGQFFIENCHYCL